MYTMVTSISSLPNDPVSKSRNRIGYIIRSVINILAPVVFFILLSYNPFDTIIDHRAIKICALTLWMLIWWITEVVPLAVTSLLPIVILPTFSIVPLKDVVIPYSSSVIFLFLGGFLIALALEKCNLHKRIALIILKLMGERANRIVLGFMLASAFLSMWISNTATAVMMLPIILSVIEMISQNSSIQVKHLHNLKVSMLLAMAYGASIGGMATLIGTPPNAIFAGYMEETYQIQVGFLEWMLFAMPAVILLLTFCFLLLTRVIYPNHIGHIEGYAIMVSDEITNLGKPDRAQKLTFFLFCMAAFLWITRSWINQLFGISLSDASIAILVGTLFFILPGNKENHKPLLDWKDTSKLPWGILLLFGGGLSIAGAFEGSGILTQFAQYIKSVDGGSEMLLILILITIMVVLTEMISNTALATIFLPIIASIGITLGSDPVIFAAPMILATSCVFSLPMGTPPNAVIFASGEIRISNMIRMGAIMDPISILLLSFFGHYMAKLMM